ncbi:MAG: hypothetical protein JNJ75_15475 [Cyclobacteriaceae bacterium]|nr:hypothetical protein [Cyclobacteriaceae bacterium]
MKGFSYFIVLILAATTSLTGCNDEDSTFGKGLPRELKLNTISYMEEVGNSLVVAGNQDFGGLTIYKLNKNFGTAWVKSNFSRGSGNLIKACYDQHGNMILFISVWHEGTSLRSSSVLSVYSTTVLIITLNPFGDEINRVQINAFSLNSVAQTNDHGFLLFGSKIVRLRADLTTVWEHTDQEDSSVSSYIAGTNDKGFVVTGAGSDYQAFLRKYDRNGVVQWTKNNFNPVPLSDVGYDVRSCGTGGFLIAGRTCEVNQSFNTNCFMIRTNSDGDTLWTKKFGTPANEYLNQILYVSDDEVIVQEQLGYPNDPVRKTFLVKLTQDGQLVSTTETDFDKLIFTRSGYFIKAKKIGDKRMLLTRLELDDLFSEQPE